MTESVYIHIPFCRQKCFYCSFVSFAMLEYIENYITSLKKEIKHFYKKEQLKTLYLGGGTPSILKSSEISEILSCFNFSEQTEVTMELNPEKIDKKYLKEIKAAGVNRLSVGCQSFDERILKLIGRRHLPSDVEFVVKTAQDEGLENISLDFIYGLPEQNSESFINDLNRAKGLNIKHISLYGLKIEEDSCFYKKPPANIADEDLQADMYIEAIKNLSDFEHYEISSFAKPDFYSRHNLTYWNNQNYYGFGAAAHGYTNQIRYSNKKDLKKYIENPIEKESWHELSNQEILEEEIFLGFRKMSGINIDNINKKFDIDFEKKYSKILKKYILSGHLIKTTAGYALNTNGILVSNLILSEFLE